MYMMPQAGIRVSLYFKGDEEESAIAVNCIRSGGFHILAAGEVKLEGQEMNLNGNRGVTMYEGKAVLSLEKLPDAEEGVPVEAEHSRRN